MGRYASQFVYPWPVRLPVDSEVRERLDRLEIPFNPYGVDPYGISKDYLGPWFSAV
jgi:hypothetical protein